MKQRLAILFMFTWCGNIIATAVPPKKAATTQATNLDRIKTIMTNIKNTVPGIENFQEPAPGNPRYTFELKYYPRSASNNFFTRGINAAKPIVVTMKIDEAEVQGIIDIYNRTSFLTISGTGTDNKKYKINIKYLNEQATIRDPLSQTS